MLSWSNIYLKLLYLKLKLLAKSEVIPSNPIKEFELDLLQPIVYVLPYNSNTDLMTLRIQCLAQDLPDPLHSLEIDGIVLSSYLFVHDSLGRSSYYASQEEAVQLFCNYLGLHCSNPNLKIQILPVSVMFGRAPGCEYQSVKNLPFLKKLRKLFAVLWYGRDSFVYFSGAVSLHSIVCKYGQDAAIAQKLVRLGRMHFLRQRLAAIGPNLLLRQNLFNKLLSSTAVENAVEDEARNKKITIDKAKQHAIVLMKEIAAHFSYEALRLSDRLLKCIWNRLYHGINVTNAGRVRQLAQDGYEIVYLPCHRSHMDYLLLSYVLYHQGLVPPHIAAGINLNFWPLGPVFRRLGAFFIRRTFKGSKLYTTVFREYLSELFARGYSVEYFVEGGRSRTGRLLEPKTGILSMTIQAMLTGGIKPIVLVPIYIGYEHVIEADTYAKELRGAPKKKEGFFQMLYGLSNLRRLGKGYVNFGDPLSLITYLNDRVPEWHESIDPIAGQRPSWLTPTVNDLAEKIMIRINNAAAANAINLCATALLASHRCALTIKQLLEQLECYLQLMRNVPYANDVTVPTQTPYELLNHALSMKQFKLEENTISDTIILSREHAMLMTYYRNNIYHLLVLPSLVATIVIQRHKVMRSDLAQQIELIYPMLKAELFLHYEKEHLAEALQSLMNEMIRQQLICGEGEDLFLNPSRICTLKLLAAGVREILQRYAVTISVLRSNPRINRVMLEKESRIIAHRLSSLHGISVSDCFDKEAFIILVATLREQGCINDTGDMLSEYTLKIYAMLRDLISPKIKRTIEKCHVSSKNSVHY